jgi:hypothetical protein
MLLASYYNAKPVGYEGFYFTDGYPTSEFGQYGELTTHKQTFICPSFKFAELLIVGTAAGAMGIKVARLRRRRSVLAPAFGLIVSLVAWLTCIIYVADYGWYQWSLRTGPRAAGESR